MRSGRTPPAARGRKRLLLLLGVVLLASASVAVLFMLSTTGAGGGQAGTVSVQSASSASSASAPVATSEPVILYVNQGNGAVNESNFASMLSLARSHGFNTIFFQMYRSGVTLFTTDQLQYFVAAAHSQSMKIYFALYFTDPSQQIPTSVYSLGEDGISLDMSALPSQAQQGLLATLQQGYQGSTAVTATDMSTTLRPDLLVLETYGAQDQGFIRHGTIASVGVFTTSTKQQYEQELQYALANSDGVMVFDYAGLLRSGY